MADVVVRLDNRVIDTLPDRFTEVRRYIQRRVDATVVVARAEAPVKSMALKRSIHATYLGGSRWTITASAPYAKFVHEGTRPHVIRARNARALRFFWERQGKVVTLRQVNHPGTAPNPFLTRAMNRVWS